MRSREDGFALVAALGAAMLFALVAYAVLASDRGAVTALSAEFTRARLEAATDAGLAVALDGLGAPPSRRWRLDGRSRSFEIDGMQVDVRVEDEAGKVLVSRMDDERIRRLLEGAGVAGPRLDQLTNSLLNWQDGLRRVEGAQEMDYIADGVRPRGYPVRTIGELMAVRGMDATTYERLAPALTVFAHRFDSSTASPLALKAMESDDARSDAKDPSAGREAPRSIDPTTDYIGRPFTVRVIASDGLGGAFSRATIVELTGQAGRPYRVRAVD